MGQSISTRLRITNYTSSDVRTTRVNPVDNYDWDGNSRPDHNLQNRFIPINGSIEEREEVNAKASHCGWSMNVYLADGREFKFGIHQKFAIGCCAGFSHESNIGVYINHQRFGDNGIHITFRDDPVWKREKDEEKKRIEEQEILLRENLKKQAEEIRVRDEELERKKKEISQKEEEIKMNCSFLQKLASGIKKTVETLNEKIKDLEKKKEQHVNIEEENKKMIKKEEEIKKKVKELSDAEDELEKNIEEKNKEIKEREKKLDERSKKLEIKKEILERKKENEENNIRDKEKELRKKEAEIEQKEAKMKLIDSSKKFCNIDDHSKRSKEVFKSVSAGKLTLSEAKNALNNDCNDCSEKFSDLVDQKLVDEDYIHK